MHPGDISQDHRVLQLGGQLPVGSASKAPFMPTVSVILLIVPCESNSGEVYVALLFESRALLDNFGMPDIANPR